MLTDAGRQSLKAVLQPFELADKHNEPQLVLRPHHSCAYTNNVVWLDLELGHFSAGRSLTLDDLQDLQKWVASAIAEVKRRDVPSNDGRPALVDDVDPAQRA